MANRDPNDQSVHDIKVLMLAKEYEEEGYDVFADLPKYERPDPISGYIPDIIAMKTKKQPNGKYEVVRIVIIEVETEDSHNSPHAFMQANAFSEYADPRPGVEFRVATAT